jgi:hypothetical protein
MARLAVSVIQLAPVAPQLERMAWMARGAVVHVRRDVRDGVRRPVPGVARGDSSRMTVSLGTFPLEHDVLPGKSNGELFPTAMFRAGYGCFFTNSASDAV